MKFRSLLTGVSFYFLLCAPNSALAQKTPIPNHSPSPNAPGAVSSVPDVEKKRAVNLVETGIRYYKEHGKEAFAEITKKNGKLRDGDLYLFVYDLSGTMVAHGQFAGSVGNNFMKSKDQDGRFYVKDRVELMKDRDEAWQKYRYLDPTTKEFRNKSSYLKKFDGYIFGCGVYTGPGD